MRRGIYKVLAVSRSVGKKLDSFSNFQVACILAIIGFAIFFTGLNNPFQGDDQYQIVDNIAVHNIANLPDFFTHSTFFNGQSLIGAYYRPLMTTTFSLLYTLFGANPLPYHVVQATLCIAGAFLVYMVFRHLFKKGYVALPLALLFLVHPLNSQVAFAIPTMQDALFFFFGMFSLWLLITKKPWWKIALCLLLALFSKESGILFAVIAAFYLWWFDRPRLKPYLLAVILCLTFYLLFMTNAVGLLKPQHMSPIDEASPAVRLMTAPSILLFYLAQFVFPLHLATGHYWLQTSFSIWGVLLPLVVDIALIGLAVFAGTRLAKKYRTPYWFFAAWTGLGVLPYLQIVRLDMTACETWFRLAMVGLLGMVGVLLLAWSKRIKPEWLVITAAVIIAVLGIQTAWRGTDYSSQYNLAVHDAAVSPQNYSALNNIAQYMIQHQRYKEAVVYAQKSINMYPLLTNYQNLGVARQQLGDYPGAIDAYTEGLRHGDQASVRENLALVYAVHGNIAQTRQFFDESLSGYPNDFRLWLYKAVFEGSRGSTEEAKVAIQKAAQFGQLPKPLYDAIMSEQPFPLPLLGKTVIVR